jgi:hypothetical protein
MIRQAAFLVFTLLSTFLADLAAQDHGFGLGVIVGEPTGISLKNWMQNSKALDGALAWSFEGEGFIQLHGDYLFHNFTLLKVEKGKLPFYYGIGGRIRFIDGDDGGKGRDKDDEARLGVRIPLGLACLFAKAPLDIFLEVVPILDLIPKSEFDLNAAVGVRFFF